VTRLCTDGHKNACSFLYARAARACREMGFSRIQTFILPDECGASLRGAGWACDGLSRNAGKGWATRNRRQDQPQGPKVRWSLQLVCAA